MSSNFNLFTFARSAASLVANLQLILAMALLGVALGAHGEPPQRSSEGPWAKGRLIVMPNPGLTDEELGAIVDAVGGKASRITARGLHLVDLPGNASETAVAARLARHPHLKFVELDRQVRATAVANDPYFGSEWHLARIGAPAAWDVSQGAGVTIAILDTGVDSTHPDLAANVVSGWNFIDNNSNTSDVHGHGTGVAGAAAAVSNNGNGVAAPAGRSKIMPVRIADANAYAYWSAIAQGVTWAADRGARVINISYDQLLQSSAVISAANYAKSKGALVVVAAGNRGQDEGYTPTSALIPVSAADSNDLITSWSSWGNFVAMSAPGLNIWSTTRGGGYGAWWGTSVASPVTASVIALMMASNPALGSGQIESLLYATADDLGAAGRDARYGYGLVNAAAAVNAAVAARPPPSDTQPPTATISAPLLASTVNGLATVSVAASDNVGVAKVELRVNGGLLATDTAAPYTFSWDTGKVANGAASLVARACDAAGNCADSAAVTVNVANVADTTPPVVAIKSPYAGVRVSGTVAFSAGATDNASVAGLTIELFINGARVASSTGSGSVSYSWNTRKSAAGSYTLRADAKDAAGNRSSTSIMVSR